MRSCHFQIAAYCSAPAGIPPRRLASSGALRAFRESEAVTTVASCGLTTWDGVFGRQRRSDFTGATMRAGLTEDRSATKTMDVADVAGAPAGRTCVVLLPDGTATYQAVAGRLVGRHATGYVDRL